ncbi:MAG: indole-3-glycerol-phosphate synthase [Euryarchaeota archaeon]|nr:indole-3-glycerol-phosphate synthase [Euryarchaeota archaeon]MBU4547994.1 indole-3-glycerol-phosphate synthase [Euryarchaeota archaeon]MBU4607913.1 indole-3-glycerol-phosphate synthase [Euryarchaeota archaeon]MBV1754415.1 indole-3-glycerol-phosphate synthase [Methanobacterium sp.]
MSSNYCRTAKGHLLDFNHILNTCKENLQKSKSKIPLSTIKRQVKNAPDPLDFKKALKKSGSFPLIIEYKPASPSQGHISSRSLEDTIKSFEVGGASAISILTEEAFFKGKLDYLKEASMLSSLPIMRKDFILDDYQIYEARACGASSVLLMSDVYPHIPAGIETCREMGMEPLVECKNSIDVYNALDADAKIIGINNRSFKDFSIDFKRTKSLYPLIPRDKIMVSESGVKSIGDVEELCRYGADALLIGTTIMQSPDIEDTIQKMRFAAEKTRKRFFNNNMSSKNTLNKGGFNK